MLCLRQRRTGEAEAHWRAVRAEQPDHRGALLGLAELCLTEQRDAELDELLEELAALPDGEPEAAVFRARRQMGCGNWAESRRLLEEATARHPEAVWPWAVLGQVLLREGRDPAAAERVLRKVLELDPDHAEARHHLAMLPRRAGACAWPSPVLTGCRTVWGHHRKTPAPGKCRRLTTRRRVVIKNDRSCFSA